MPARRDLRALLAAAVLGGVIVALGLTVAGLDTGLLLLSPALVLVIPLLAGRYVGERRLERLAARFAPRRPRPASSAAPRLRLRVGGARGGRLIAVALAERGPPPALA
jgi:hypothetical protein